MKNTFTVSDFSLNRLKEQADNLCKAYLFGADFNDCIYLGVYQDEHSNLVALGTILKMVGSFLGYESEIYLYIKDLFEKCVGGPNDGN